MKKMIALSDEVYEVLTKAKRPDEKQSKKHSKKPDLTKTPYTKAISTVTVHEG